MNEKTPPPPPTNQNNLHIHNHPHAQYQLKEADNNGGVIITACRWFNNGGRCHYGDQCNAFHIIVTNKYLSWFEWNDDNNHKNHYTEKPKKIGLCRSFPYCRKAHHCFYLHDYRKQPQPPQLLPLSQPLSQSLPQSFSSSPNLIPNNKYIDNNRFCPNIWNTNCNISTDCVSQHLCGSCNNGEILPDCPHLHICPYSLDFICVYYGNYSTCPYIHLTLAKNMNIYVREDHHRQSSPFSSPPSPLPKNVISNEKVISPKILPPHSPFSSQSFFPAATAAKKENDNNDYSLFSFSFS